MAVYTKTELETQLAEVQAAITKTLEAQSYDTGNASVLRARLESLRQFRKDLMEEIELIDTQNSGSFANKVEFVKPS